ncbi:P-loop containing nucleoside triphosphate hydrolase protein [Cyathus striatus]|nr:P-loop containing nucleoside triphosphate hydrolase protein [Cyathus striatus]
MASNKATSKKKDTILAEVKDCVVKDGRLDDIIIVVMGSNGVGKSTFVNTFFGADVTAVGKGDKPCTSGLKPIIHSHPVDSFRRLVVVDTPGFDDTQDDGTDILERLSVWLEASDKKISGFVYLHDISKTARRTGPARRIRSFFRRLCGDESHSSVVLGTTKWSGTIYSEVKLLLQRLKYHFWRDLSEDGSEVFNFDNTRESAWDIVRFLLNRHWKTTPEVIFSLESTFSTIIRMAANLQIPDETISHVSRDSFQFDSTSNPEMGYSARKLTYTKEVVETRERRSKRRSKYKRGLDGIIPPSKRDVRKRKPLLPIRVFKGKLEWPDLNVWLTQGTQEPQKCIDLLASPGVDPPVGDERDFKEDNRGSKEEDLRVEGENPLNYEDELPAEDDIRNPSVEELEDFEQLPYYASKLEEDAPSYEETPQAPQNKGMFGKANDFGISNAAMFDNVAKDSHVTVNNTTNNTINAYNINIDKNVLMDILRIISKLKLVD